jgi:WD40 repeat protein
MVWLLAAAGVLTFGGRARADDKPPTKVEFKGWFSKPVFTADGKTLVYAQMAALPYGARTAPTQIVLWSVRAGKEIRRIDGPADDSLLGPIALSADGTRLAMGLWNTAVRIWDLDNGKEVGRPMGSQGAQHLRFTPDGRTVGWVRDGDIHLADAASAKELRRITKDADGPATAFAFLDDGKSVIAGYVQRKDVSGPGAGKNRTLQHDTSYWVRDAVSGKKVRPVGEAITETRKSLEGPPLAGLFVSADGKTVALAGDRGSIQICTAATGKKERDLPVPWKAQDNDPIRRLAFSGDLHVAAAGTAKGTITVWDLATAKELRRVETGQSIDHLTLAPDGKTLAVTYQTPGQVGAVLLIFRL